MSEPTDAKHGTFYDIEPHTGTVVRFRRSWQLNVQIEPTPEVESLSRLRKVLLPVYWTEEEGEMSGEELENIKNVIKPKKVFNILQWISVTLGALGFTIGATYFILWK